MSNLNRNLLLISIYFYIYTTYIYILLVTMKGFRNVWFGTPARVMANGGPRFHNKKHTKSRIKHVGNGYQHVNNLDNKKGAPNRGTFSMEEIMRMKQLQFGDA